MVLFRRIKMRTGIKRQIRGKVKGMKAETTTEYERWEAIVAHAKAILKYAKQNVTDYGKRDETQAARVYSRARRIQKLAATIDKTGQSE